jgi:hypothetical protein
MKGTKQQLTKLGLALWENAFIIKREHYLCTQHLNVLKKELEKKAIHVEIVKVEPVKKNWYDCEFMHYDNQCMRKATFKLFTKWVKKRIVKVQLI